MGNFHISCLILSDVTADIEMYWSEREPRSNFIFYISILGIKKKDWEQKKNKGREEKEGKREGGGRKEGRNERKKEGRWMDGWREEGTL